MWFDLFGQAAERLYAGAMQAGAHVGGVLVCDHRADDTQVRHIPAPPTHGGWFPWRGREMYELR